MDKKAKNEVTSELKPRVTEDTIKQPQVLSLDEVNSQSIFKVKPVKYKAFSNDKQGCIR